MPGSLTGHVDIRDRKRIAPEALAVPWHLLREGLGVFATALSASNMVEAQARESEGQRLIDAAVAEIATLREIDESEELLGAPNAFGLIGASARQAGGGDVALAKLDERLRQMAGRSEDPSSLGLGLNLHVFLGVAGVASTALTLAFAGVVFAAVVGLAAVAAVLARRSRARRLLLLFLVAAVAEIGGAWLIWQGVREHRGWVWAGAGVMALGLYGFVATLQPDAHFGRILAAYGGCSWPARWLGAS